MYTEFTIQGMTDIWLFQCSIYKHIPLCSWNMMFASTVSNDNIMTTNNDDTPIVSRLITNYKSIVVFSY